MPQNTRICLKHILLSAGLTPLVLLGGCEPKKHQVATRIEQDGQFHRKLLVALDDSLPPEALNKSKRYPPSTQPADYKLQPAWLKLWNDQQSASAPAETQEGNYFETAGHFATAEKIPRHYHLIAYPFEDRASTNQIKHSYDDYSLFGIDYWTETITETVFLPEYVATVDEMIAMLTPVIEGTLDEVFEQEYDLRDFHPYLRKHLAPAFRNFALWCYQFRPDSGDEALSPNALQQLKQILADIGFELLINEAGDAIDHDRIETSFKSCLLTLLQTRIRSRATGDYLTTEQAKTLMPRLNIDPDEEVDEGDESKQESQAETAPASSAPAEDPLKDKLDHFDEILARNFETLHHTPLEETALIWGAKMGGAHRKSFVCLFDPACKFFDDRVFNYELRTPGPILETNGKLLGSQAVTWRFYPGNTWPQGYKMHASAIRWNREAEKKLFGRVVLNDLDTVLRLRKSIIDRKTEDNQKIIREALRNSVEQGSLNPLKTLAASTNAEERDAAQAVLDLKGDK